MCEHAKNIEEGKQHSYEIKKRKIGYKENNEVNHKINYPYLTLFANFKEIQNKNIDKSELDDKIGFTFNCGSYSYAEFPK